MKRWAARRLHLIWAAGAVGIACGAAARNQLPAAGSDRDDGSGVLAAASIELYTPPPGYGGAAYGAVSYSRSARYGGGRYANYQFRTGSGHRRGYPSSYRDGYTVTPAGPTGRIAGTVRWRRKPTLATRPGCPPPPTPPARAIISLADVQRGPGFAETRLRDRSRFQLGGVIAIGPCGFEPQVTAIGPVGLLGTAVQRGEGKARIIGALAGAGEVLFELDFRSRGERRPFEMSRPGLIELTGDGGATGWIAVLGHPLYAAADPDGRFVIDKVPAGTHTLEVWHPPVSGDEAIELSRQIAVRANATTRVSLRLDSASRPARRTRGAGSPGR